MASHSVLGRSIPNNWSLITVTAYVFLGGDAGHRLARRMLLEAVSKLQGMIVWASKLHTRVSERRLSHGRFSRTLDDAAESRVSAATE